MAVTDTTETVALNTAARELLAHHVRKDLSKGWPYAAHVAIEAICKTYTSAPLESERALLGLLSPERLVHFPHNDLHDLAQNLNYLGNSGAEVIRRLFEASFADEPERGKWDSGGSAILPLRFQTSDQWKLIRFVLAEYYQSRSGEDAALMTEAACIAWNSVARRRMERRDGEEKQPLGTIIFRGVPCPLVEDYSHIWGRGFEQDENRILTHFEKLLRQWTDQGDTEQLNAALDRFARCNRTSVLWTVFLEAGAEYPNTLGTQLRDVLNEPSFLSHPDYSYGGTALLGALHTAGDVQQRKYLETLILNLPSRLAESKNGDETAMRSWAEHNQNRLLNMLDPRNVVLEEIRNLYSERQERNELTANEKPSGPSAAYVGISEEERLRLRGINARSPTSQELLRLRDELKRISDRQGQEFPVSEIESHWALLQECEHAVKRYKPDAPEMAKELWGYLVGVSENIANNAVWEKTSVRWKTVRRILLKAAKDPFPPSDDDRTEGKDEWPSWVSPSPRIDAARGLPALVYRLECADRSATTALRRLCVDTSHSVRFNLAERLWWLERANAALMWELIDILIEREQRFSVLDVLLFSLDRLWSRASDEVRRRLQQITDRVMQNAPADNHIYETLSGIHLFHYLRTANRDGEAFVSHLINECDSERASRALAAQLHACREGGWLTAEDHNNDAEAGAVRGRTWDFFLNVLTGAQEKLEHHRETWIRLRKNGQSDTDKSKIVNEKIERASLLVDGVAQQLYFASGAFEEKRTKDHKFAGAKLERFWLESKPLFVRLAPEVHPHVTYQIIQTLDHLLPCAPREIFLLAIKSIKSSTQTGFQYEALAVAEVVRLVQRVLADHREIFLSSRESECLNALLEVLDLFVDVGWPEARHLTHRLEEIYR